jgi:hypothetical protein
MDYLRDLLNSYMSDHQQCSCSQNCDAMVLGSLMKGLNARGLFPLPEADALAMSIKDLFSQLRTMNLASLCQADRMLAMRINRDINRRFESTLTKLESQVSGLRLADHLA